MTKQKAIKELVKRGWTFIRNDGKFSVVLSYPAASKYAGQEGVFDPRDLLEDMVESELRHLSNRTDLQRKDGESQNDYLARLIFGDGPVAERECPHSMIRSMCEQCEQEEQ